MSYNQNFYNNFHGTFQNSQFLPPPPPPPAFFIPPPSSNTDADFVKQFGFQLPRTINKKPKCSISISMVRDDICNLISKLKEIKSKESILTENINNLSDEDWSSNMRQIEETKSTINKLLADINVNVEVLQKLVARRSAKRARLKRLRSERKKEKDEWITEMKERSRRIDEKLQKRQDDIRKAKQEQEAKLQADIVLKETLRKKHDAKKYAVKLDALMKLRRARMNTARGRGENVSEVEAETFNSNIEKLKTLWKQRLTIYEKEESDLRAKLEENPEFQQSEISSKESEMTVDNLEKWKEALFGGGLPQVDFSGDIARFISVRREWDEFVSRDGSCLPVGWVPPSSQ